MTTGPIPQVRKLKDTEKEHSRYKRQRTDSQTDIKAVLTDCFCFCDYVSCGLGWPQTHCVAQAGTEPPTHLASTFQAPGFLNSRYPLYHLSYIPAQDRWILREFFLYLLALNLSNTLPLFPISTGSRLPCQDPSVSTSN